MFLSFVNELDFLFGRLYFYDEYTMVMKMSTATTTAKITTTGVKIEDFSFSAAFGAVLESSSVAV